MSAITIAHARKPDTIKTGSENLSARLFAALGCIALAFVAAPAAGQPAQPIAATLALPSTAPGAPDPFAWLEDIHGARAEAWVKDQNEKSEARFDADPRFAKWRDEAQSLYTATDRIPEPAFLGDRLTNLWDSGDHPKGVWRATTAASFRTAAPEWRTLLDVDALSKAESRNWVFRDAICLPPADQLCLLKLSDGGGDAVEIREFDTVANAFVPHGFRFPAGKQDVAWLDANTLLVSRDWGPGTISTSGYALVIKVVKRGQPLDQAREVFRGTTPIGVVPRVLRNPDGKVGLSIVEVNQTSSNSEWFELTPGGTTRRLDLPRNAVLRGYVDKRLILTLGQDWPVGKGHAPIRQGTVVAVDPDTGVASAIFQPTDAQSVDDVMVTAHRVIVSLLDNVDGAIEVFAPKAGRWRARRLALPDHSGIEIVAADPASDRAYLTTESFLVPRTLWEVDAADVTASAVKRLPPRFDASRDVVEQNFAVSSDGTRIPYFVVRPRAMKFDGTSPTFMFGYGGFQASELPFYSAVVGKFWLEHGGVYVQANIRGGGEFGPAWHEAAVGEHRQLAFDDFAAIARDLIARGITSPRRLGIWGASNGGVLISVSIVQHPELFNAAIIKNPIIDMLRFSHLSTGAQWIGEFGDPDIPADHAWLARYSAYQNLKPGVRYPEVFLSTNAADDRVHPAHARKFAAELEALGNPLIYLEGDSGGHHGSVDVNDSARAAAQNFVYLTEKLMD